MASSIVSRGLDQLCELLGLVGPDDVGRATPCAEWNVGDLSDHIVNSVIGMTTMAQGGQPDWAATTHYDDASSALAEQGRQFVEALSGGSGGFPEGMAAAELAVHAYDLATGLGRSTDDLDPEVAETGHGFMTASMTPEMRGGAFGPEQPAPATANAYERIAAFAGRRVA